MADKGASGTDNQAIEPMGVAGSVSKEEWANSGQHLQFLISEATMDQTDAEILADAFEDIIHLGELSDSDDEAGDVDSITEAVIERYEDEKDYSNVAVQATFAPSERVISIASRAISKLRTQMNPSMAEQLLFLKENWTSMKTPLENDLDVLELVSKQRMGQPKAG